MGSYLPHEIVGFCCCCLFYFLICLFGLVVVVVVVVVWCGCCCRECFLSVLFLFLFFLGKGVFCFVVDVFFAT